ncbi:MAG: D-sedoheptulose 7-phosphate isomerase, partial [Gammaproteobacteria bacterium]
MTATSNRGSSVKSHILSSLHQSQDMLATFLSNADNISNIENGARLLLDTLKNRGSIYSCGNGGSMSDAMHFAEELSGRYRKSRGGLSATAISDPGHITCVANDFGYEYIFSRYLEANANSGDCLLAISTSGTSKNVIKAIEYAKQNGIKVISLTGAPNTAAGKLAD